MKPKTLAQIEEQRPAPIQDEATALIAQAIDKNVSVDVMERLLVIRRELKQERAKEEYDRAMAEFQVECPTIQKKTQGYNYKYADLTTIIEQVKELLSQKGFSYTFDTDENPDGITVFCKVKHISGHMETSKALIKRESTTKMNASQQSGAAMTYGKRYAFVNAFGILTGDEDTDAADPHVSTSSLSPTRPTIHEVKKEISLPINDEQKGDMISLLGKLGKTQIDLNKLVMAQYKKGSYQLLTKNEADSVIRYLKNKTESQTVGKLASVDDVPGMATITEQEIDAIDKEIEQQRLEK